ncbi:hypothetical protein GH714_022370 [Hevea brasiliensis]|uniref:dihydroxy-acid dehydratase n=1 Tax=Hevea brasiliensis TaxID=3981 RepID=A0A6A6MPD3_HEVBR|nr:hypothetical protein GH714_022370 [Hevea brasiliensis]
MILPRTCVEDEVFITVTGMVLGMVAPLVVLRLLNFHIDAAENIDTCICLKDARYNYGNGRLNRPSIMVYGGTIKPGHYNGHSYDIISAFQNLTIDSSSSITFNPSYFALHFTLYYIRMLGRYGEYVNGSISDEDRKNVVHNSCPGAGACGGMYTANTMASAIEAMGMCLPYSSSIPAENPLKLDECRLAGKYLLELLKMDLKPQILSLLSHYVMQWLLSWHWIGGTPAVLRYLLEHGFLDGDCLTVTGKTLAENVQNCPPLSEGQDIIRPLENPIKKTGHIHITRELAPEGSVAKITGKEGLYFSGPALVFEGEEAMLAAISENPMNFKGKVVVIRGEGPKGGPGMPEMLTPTSAIMGAGLGKDCALLTDGRFSGGSHGFVVGHICPEAQEGGPIGLVRNGDIIRIDVRERRIDVDVTDQEMEERRKNWTPPPYKATCGVLYKYIKNVQSASRDV